MRTLLLTLVKVNGEQAPRRAASTTRREEGAAPLSLDEDEKGL